MKGTEASPWRSLPDCNDKVSDCEGSGMVTRGKPWCLRCLQPLWSLQVWDFLEQEGDDHIPSKVNHHSGQHVGVGGVVLAPVL